MSPAAELAAAIKAFEEGKPLSMSADTRWAVLAGLGSKYLAVGSPDSVGLIHCGSAAPAIAACHALLFGALEIKVSGATPPPGISEALSCDLEEAFACDIVCLPCTTEFDMAWIAEATHLNLRYATPGPSVSARQLFQSCAVTLESQHGDALPREHGSLHQVIIGQVSGRMADELTLLFHD